MKISPRKMRNDSWSFRFAEPGSGKQDCEELIMELSFDEIRRIHRLEKNTSRLVEVDPDFFSALADFALKQRGKKGAAEGLRQMVEEILALREKKILNLALMALRTGEASEEHMALQEKKMFSAVLSELRGHAGMLDKIFPEQDSSEKPEDKQALNNLSVKILSKVPGFVGTDMKEYGPFAEGQSVSLPYDIAKLLIARGLVAMSE